MNHFRTHKNYSIDLNPAVTLITGANGSGKTSLLEAIYITLQGRSFKDSDSDILQVKAPWYRIDLKTNAGAKRTVKFDPTRETGKKQFILDNKTHYRLTFNNKYPVVLFEPDELRLINGSPTRRRQFIDSFIAQFDPEYALSLRRYDRALKQRNMLLKSPIENDDLFVWDVSLSKYGAYIASKRIEIIDQLRPRLEEVYKEIASSKDNVSMRYSDQQDSFSEQKLLKELHQNAERDRTLGYTSAGPHRHDILFYLNSNSAAHSASRGEIRTIVLALKFLEVDILTDKTSHPPIILLDDVFSELDEPRQQALLNRFSGHQTIITSVSAPKATKFTVHRLSG